MTLLFREYRYRKTFGITHEEYLNEPAGIVEWLTQIDQLMKEF